MIKRLLVLWMMGLTMLFMHAVARADAADPQQFLDRLSQQMVTALHQHKHQLQQDQVIFKLVDQIYGSHIAFHTMARSVITPKYWDQATAQQRQTFIREFTQLVVSIYSSALSAYDNDKIKVMPVSAQQHARRLLRVRSLIIRPSGQSIPVDYLLIRAGKDWKILDISIEHISLIRSYREQFVDVLAQTGIAGLIKQLSTMNQKNKS